MEIMKKFKSTVAISSATTSRIDNGYTITVYVRSVDPTKYDYHEFKMFFNTFAGCVEFQTDVMLKIDEVNQDLAAEEIERVQ
jgi:hypothetical protein